MKALLLGDTIPKKSYHSAFEWFFLLSIVLSQALLFHFYNGKEIGTYSYPYFSGEKIEVKWFGKVTLVGSKLLIPHSNSFLTKLWLSSMWLKRQLAYEPDLWEYKWRSGLKRPSD